MKVPQQKIVAIVSSLLFIGNISLSGNNAYAEGAGGNAGLTLDQSTRQPVQAYNPDAPVEAERPRVFPGTDPSRMGAFNGDQSVGAFLSATSTLTLSRSDDDDEADERDGDKDSKRKVKKPDIVSSGVKFVDNNEKVELSFLVKNSNFSKDHLQLTLNNKKDRSEQPQTVDLLTAEENPDGSMLVTFEVSIKANTAYTADITFSVLAGYGKDNQILKRKRNVVKFSTYEKDIALANLENTLGTNTGLLVDPDTNTATYTPSPTSSTPTEILSLYKAIDPFSTIANTEITFGLTDSQQIQNATVITPLSTYEVALTSDLTVLTVSADSDGSKRTIVYDSTNQVSINYEPLPQDTTDEKSIDDYVNRYEITYDDYGRINSVAQYVPLDPTLPLTPPDGDNPQILVRTFVYEYPSVNASIPSMITSLLDQGNIEFRLKDFIISQTTGEITANIVFTRPDGREAVTSFKADSFYSLFTSSRDQLEDYFSRQGTADVAAAAGFDIPDIYSITVLPTDSSLVYKSTFLDSDGILHLLTATVTIDDNGYYTCAHVIETDVNGDGFVNSQDAKLSTDALAKYAPDLSAITGIPLEGLTDSVRPVVVKDTKMVFCLPNGSKITYFLPDDITTYMGPSGNLIKAYVNGIDVYNVISKTIQDTDTAITSLNQEITVVQAETEEKIESERTAIAAAQDSLSSTISAVTSAAAATSSTELKLQAATYTTEANTYVDRTLALDTQNYFAYLTNSALSPLRSQIASLSDYLSRLSNLQAELTNGGTADTIMALIKAGLSSPAITLPPVITPVPSPIEKINTFIASGNNLLSAITAFNSQKKTASRRGR